MENGLTILGEEQIWGDTALEVIKKYGTKVAITDLAILTGADFYCIKNKTITLNPFNYREIH